MKDPLDQFLDLLELDELNAFFVKKNWGKWDVIEARMMRYAMAFKFKMKKSQYDSMSDFLNSLNRRLMGYVS